MVETSAAMKQKIIPTLAIFVTRKMQVEFSLDVILTRMRVRIGWTENHNYLAELLSK